MTAAVQSDTGLACAKTGCDGRYAVAQTWPAKKEKFLCTQLECPKCHLRDWQTFPVPERVWDAAIPFEFGCVVEHAIHGRGMVVSSGPNFTRVCFQGSKGKEQECFTADLQLSPAAEELNAYRQTRTAVNRKTGQRTTVSFSDFDPQTPPDRPGHRAFVPDANADDLPGRRDMSCELCGEEQVRLVFTERLWVCQKCREYVDIGDSVVRGSE